MRIDKALEQISEIHEHMAKSQLYRGYRATPFMLTGILAILAAWIQPFVVSSADPRIYVLYWTLIAVASCFIAAGGVMLNYLRDESPHERKRTQTVVGQLTPCLTVGVIVTAAFSIAENKDLMYYLPAIWSLLFGLGLSASKPFLPRMIGWVALFYLLCGCVLLHRIVVLGVYQLSPWETGIPFGVGYIFSGLILYWNLERNHRE
ncbi:hypothetical protein JXA32_03860 [Candidatus Sumerlaeota bacterium]|nr:hypothetical protein [Candidatus Sumerlaeota bacterium]